MASIPWHWHNILVVLAFCSYLTAGKSTSYTSVHAFDKYGHSDQLENAKEAACRGRLVVAGQSSTNEIVVVSLGTIGRPIVHPVTIPVQDFESGATDGIVAICCTGVMGDATWVIQQVQNHAKRIWERYNHQMSAATVAHLVGRLLGYFQRNNVDQEWQSSVGRKEAECARPLGIQTMVLSQDSPILIVEVSGRVKSKKFTRNGVAIRAIGKDHQLIEEKLRSMELDIPDKSALEKFLIGLVLDGAPRGNIVEVLVEVVSGHEIQRTSLRFKNGKQIRHSPSLL